MRPLPSACHTQKRIFVRPKLVSYVNVYLHEDIVNRINEKVFYIKFNNKTANVSVNRFKPTFTETMQEESTASPFLSTKITTDITDVDSTQFNMTAPTITQTRSGRRIKHTIRFNTWPPALERQYCESVKVQFWRYKADGNKASALKSGKKTGSKALV